MGKKIKKQKPIKTIVFDISLETGNLLKIEGQPATGPDGEGLILIQHKTFASFLNVVDTLLSSEEKNNLRSRLAAPHEIMITDDGVLLPLI